MHGIVVEDGETARLLHNEPELGYHPVRIHVTEEGEKLSKESRINYNKLVTVDYDVKILFIGRGLADDWGIVSCHIQLR